MGSERCEIASCGFAWDHVDPNSIGSRIVTSAGVISAILRSAEFEATRRSHVDVWSPIEYAAHVRDVLFNLRDRLIVALNEENPVCKGLYGSPRVDTGLYDGDGARVVATELDVAAAMFTKTWERIPVTARSRTMVYGYPTIADRSLTWVAAQALHEVEHHLADVRAALPGSPASRSTCHGAVVFVDDLANAAVFYTAVLSAQSVDGSVEEGWIRLAVGTFELWLHATPDSTATSRPSAGGSPRVREGHPVKLLFTLSDTADLASAVTRFGGVVIERPWGIDYADPEGNVFGVDGAVD